MEVRKKRVKAVIFLSIVPNNTLACGLEKLGIEPHTFYLVGDFRPILSPSHPGHTDLRG